MTLGRVPVPQTGPDENENLGGEQSSPWGTEQVEFLRWLAGWLDKIDPILQAVFSKAGDGLYTIEERSRIIAWLDGTDVQKRLRTMADAISANPVPPASAERSSPESGSVAALEGRVRELEAALEAVATNAEDWHGPVEIDVYNGHARALDVIATTARAALVGAVLEPRGSDSGSARGASEDGTDAGSPA